jgi:predicted unusual protein kinase regulating ubiquinone biosynthesis (AarF/ABC1/UbiB family)
MTEFFDLGLVQTDPNYGNFLVGEDEGTLVLLDFGATKSYSPTFRAQVRSLLKLAYACDNERLIKSAIEFELLDPREDEKAQQLFCELMETVVYMFRSEVQPFNFADTDFLSEIREVAMNFANGVQYTAPAKHMIFLNRKLGGMFHLMKDAGCGVDLTPYWNRAMALDLA